MSNARDPQKDEPLEAVAVSGTAEAQMIEEILRNNGIDCSMQGNVSSNPWPATSDLDEVRTFVRQSDVARVEELVSAYFSSAGKSVEVRPVRP